MENKLFGEYLVEKEYVTEQAMVDALVEQVKVLPSVLELTVNQTLLAPNQILSALALQTRKQIGFVDACRELEVWSEEMDQKILGELNRVRTPIGQILVKQGGSNFEVLIRALDDFLCEVGRDDKPSQTPVENVPATPVTEVREEKESGAETGKAESHDIDPDLIGNYSEVLSHEMRAQFESLFQSLLNQLENIPDSSPESECKEAFDHFHTCMGAARFVRANYSEKLALEAETVFLFVKKKIDKVRPEDIEKLATLGTQTVNILWKLRDVLATSHSEQPFLDNEEQKNEFEKVYGELQLFKFDFGML